jgi:uncharacterized protein with PIN domain
MRKTERTRFIVDTMLGDLAKWLRILGYDTLYSRNYRDSQIVNIAKESKRVVVTMDRGLCILAKKNGVRCLIIESFDIRERLAEISVKAGIPLVANPSKSRCPLCNGELKPVYDKSVVRDRVPPRVLELNKVFYVCTRCGQVYWEGSHWNNIRRVLEEARVIAELLLENKIRLKKKFKISSS